MASAGANIFVDSSDSTPLCFHLMPCAEKPRISALIHQHGGKCTSFHNNPNEIKLISDKHMQWASQQHVHIDYIEACVNAGKLVDITPFSVAEKRKKKTGQADVISASSASDLPETCEAAKKATLITSLFAPTSRLSLPGNSSVPSPSNQSTDLTTNKEAFTSALRLLPLAASSPFTQTGSSQPKPYESVVSPTRPVERQLVPKTTADKNNNKADDHNSANDSESLSPGPQVNQDMMMVNRLRKSRSRFTTEKDILIIQAVVAERARSLTGGNTLWKQIVSRHPTLAGHTWQSVRDHYLRTIMPNLATYSIPNHWFVYIQRGITSDRLPQALSTATTTTTTSSTNGTATSSGAKEIMSQPQQRKALDFVADSEFVSSTQANQNDEADEDDTVCLDSRRPPKPASPVSYNTRKRKHQKDQQTDNQSDDGQPGSPCSSSLSNMSESQFNEPRLTIVLSDVNSPHKSPRRTRNAAKSQFSSNSDGIALRSGRAVGGKHLKTLIPTVTKLHVKKKHKELISDSALSTTSDEQDEVVDYKHKTTQTDISASEFSPTNQLRFESISFATPLPPANLNNNSRNTTRNATEHWLATGQWSGGERLTYGNAPSISSSMMSGRIPWTLDEDISMIRYVSKHRRIDEIGGNVLYQDMEYNTKVAGSHSWHSIRDRFRKKILPNLHRFRDLSGVDTEWLDYLSGAKLLNRNRLPPQFQNGNRSQVHTEGDSSTNVRQPQRSSVGLVNHSRRSSSGLSAIFPRNEASPQPHRPTTSKVKKSTKPLFFERSSFTLPDYKSANSTMVQQPATQTVSHSSDDDEDSFSSARCD